MADSSHMKNQRSGPLHEVSETSARDIIVIGGSAGAIEVIGNILSDLPADLGAAVFVVVHTGGDSPNYLVNIFSKLTKLPVQYATDHEPIELGKVYVAPNDRHLLIKRGEMRVILGPKENNFRPALDPLFRTAATTYDGRVMGVVVSGSLDDGTHGLQQIKRAGGVTIAQSPEEAIHNGMPQSAVGPRGGRLCQTGNRNCPAFDSISSLTRWSFGAAWRR